MSSAAAIIIGDEILKGKFADQNTPFFIRRCSEIGVDLDRVLLIPDRAPVIAEAVAKMSAEVDHVFTSGGVGPTHDDVTMAGVAAAFGVALVRDQELAQVIRERFGAGAGPDALRMADLPEGAELWWDGDLFFPLVVVRNVCIFPGVPDLVVRKFNAICHRFSGEVLHTRSLQSTARESEIAQTLRDAVAAFPTVAIGSYPQFRTRPWTVTVTMDGRDPAALDACLQRLRTELADSLVDEPPP